MTQFAIVEDNQNIRKCLVELLQSDPEYHCVSACSTAEEALTMLPKLQPEIVLMDIGLPNMSGIECVAELKRLMPAVQIIMVTVYEDTIRIFQALRAGASGYLLKRYTSAELLSAVREIQQGGAPMSREIARKVLHSFQTPLAANSEVEKLTGREREILELLSEGLANKAIAQHIGLSTETIRWHLRHIYNKLHVRSRMEASKKFRATDPG